MIFTHEYSKAERTKALKALDKAKALEAKRRASGAKFERIDGKTLKLSL